MATAELREELVRGHFRNGHWVQPYERKTGRRAEVDPRYGVLGKRRRSAAYNAAVIKSHDEANAWLDSLNAREKRAIASWGRTGYKRINPQVRAGDESHWAIPHLRSAIAKGGLARPTRMYRGIKPDVLGPVEPGDIIEDKGFQAGAEDPDWAASYAHGWHDDRGRMRGGDILVMDLPKGFPVGRIGASGYADFDESLLPSGTSWQVQRVRLNRASGSFWSVDRVIYVTPAAPIQEAELPRGGRKKQGQGFKGRKSRGAGGTRASGLEHRFEVQTIAEIKDELGVDDERAAQIRAQQSANKQLVDRQVAGEVGRLERERGRKLNKDEIERTARRVAQEFLQDAAVQQAARRAAASGKEFTPRMEDEARRSVASGRRKLTTARRQRQSPTASAQRRLQELIAERDALIKDFERKYGPDDWRPRWQTYLNRQGEEVRQRTGGITEDEQDRLASLKSKIDDLDRQLGPDLYRGQRDVTKADEPSGLDRFLDIAEKALRFVQTGELPKPAEPERPQPRLDRDTIPKAGVARDYDELAPLPGQEVRNPYDAMRTAFDFVRTSGMVEKRNDGQLRIVHHTPSAPGEAGARHDLGRVAVVAMGDLPHPDRGQVALRLFDAQDTAIAEYPIDMERRGDQWIVSKPGELREALRLAKKVLRTKDVGREEPDLDIHLIPQPNGTLRVTAAPVDAADPINQQPSRELVRDTDRILVPDPDQPIYDPWTEQGRKRAEENERRRRLRVSDPKTGHTRPMKPLPSNRPVDLVGAAKNVAGGMLRQTKKPKRARIILHDHTGAREHIADVKAEREPGKGRGLTYRISDEPGEFTFRWPKGTPWRPKGVGPGRFRARNLSEGQQHFREAFGLSYFERARREIRRAHRRFQFESLQRLFPDVSGPLFEARFQEEVNRDEAYMQNMEARLRREIDSALHDPTLSRRDRRAKAAGALARERVYFRRHLVETSWRMARHAELLRLKETGVDRAYWLLDKGLKTHTKDCLAMAGKVWDWSVLDEINPANRHPGCGCRLISVAEAQSRGLATPAGVQTQALLDALQEFRVYVPSMSGNPWHDSETGRFVGGVGTLRSLPFIGDAFSRGFAELKAAAYDADLDRAWKTRGRLMRIARGRLPHGKGATPAQNKLYQEALRTIQRAYEAVENNAGQRQRMGQGVAVAPIEERGRLKPWTATGSYQWRVPASAEELNRISKIKGVEARTVDGRLMVSTRDRATAREIEIAFPALRSLRFQAVDKPLDDERPLDIGPEESPWAASRQEKSRVPLVSTRQLGDSAEVLLYDVARRMKSLGIIESTKNLTSGTEAGVSEVDWVMNAREGPFGIEVKATAFRGLTPDMAGPDAKMDAQWVRRKNAAAEKQGLQPAVMHAITDVDNDVVHMFFQPFGITNKRVPKRLMDDLWDGHLRPGDSAYTAKDVNKRDPTVYVGSFRMRFNPLVGENVSRVVRRRDATAIATREPAPPLGDMGMKDRVNRYALPKRRERPLSDRERRALKAGKAARAERNEIIRRFLDNDLNAADRKKLREYKARETARQRERFPTYKGRISVPYDPRNYVPPTNQAQLAQDLKRIWGIDVHQTTISRIKREIEEDLGVAVPRRRRGPNKPKDQQRRRPTRRQSLDDDDRYGDIGRSTMDFW